MIRKPLLKYSPSPMPNLFSKKFQRILSWAHRGIFFLFFLLPSLVLADTVCEGFGNDCYGLHPAAGAAGFKKITTATPSIIVGRIIQYILSFVGVVFMILVIYGGAYWMFAQGNEEKVDKARKMIISAAIGLLIVMSAYILTRLVTDQLISIVESPA